MLHSVFRVPISEHGLGFSGSGGIWNRSKPILSLAVTEQADLSVDMGIVASHVVLAKKR